MFRQFDENLNVYVNHVKTLSKNDFFRFRIQSIIQKN